MKKRKQTALDRDLAISLRQMRQGKVSPTYNSAREFILDLHRRVKRLQSKKKS